jgi:hypothetical protein
MFKTFEKTMKIVPFWHSFVAKLLVERQFYAYNSVGRPLIFNNPNFHRSSVCLVRAINFFLRPSERGKDERGKKRKKSEREKKAKKKRKGERRMLLQSTLDRRSRSF